MTLLDYQGTYNGLTIGPGQPVGILQIDGWEELPDIRNGDTPRPRAAGSLRGLDLPGERTITATLDIASPLGMTISNYLDTVKMAFTTSESDEPPLTLQLPGQVARRSYCRIRKRTAPIDISYESGLAKMVVQFVASNSRIYSDTLHSLSTPLRTPTSGATFPATFPFTFGAGTGGGGTISCTNAGDYLTQGVATITGPCINPRVQNSGTNETLALNITLGSTDVLVIDFMAHTVILNGNGYRYSDVTQNDWWSLAPGVTTVAFYSSDPSPTGATMTYAWRDAWL